MPGRWYSRRHPHELAFVGDYEVWVGVPFEEIGQLGQALPDMAVDHHAALGGEEAGEQDLRVAFAEAAAKRIGNEEIGSRPCLRRWIARCRRRGS